MLGFDEKFREGRGRKELKKKGRSGLIKTRYEDR
jgi:hypothetical protein